MSGIDSATVVPDLLAQRARLSPAARAMYFKDGAGRWQSLAWQEVERAVHVLAVRLQSAGLQPGERVAIRLRVCAEWELLRQGVLRAGGVVVGIDAGATDEHVAHILSTTRPVCLVAENLDDVRQLAELHPSATLRLFTNNADACTVNRHSQHDAEYVDCTASTATIRKLDSVAIVPDDPATIIFTSGSTGAPKGIEYSHRQILFACQAISELYPELAAGDRTVCWLPMAHLYQRMINLLAIKCGMASYFVSDAERISEYLREIQPAFFVGVPRLFEKLADEIRQHPEETSAWRRSVKYAVSGSAPIDPALLQFLVEQGVLVLEAYGTTENVVPVAASTSQARRFGAVGRPLPQNEIRFTDEGELLVKGPGVFRGYVDGSGGDRFDGDGFYATGDFGYLDEEGYLFLTGRKSDVIKTSTGRKIAPAQVESVYKQARLVDQVAVFGDGRKRLVALVTLDQRQSSQLSHSLLTGDQKSREIALHNLVRSDFERLERRLPYHERISEFAIVERPFSVRLGELTPTLKLRRERIGQIHRKAIETLYASPTAADLPAIESPPAPAKRILLTGGTGVVGSSLLPWLAEQSNTHVYVLIRASSSRHVRERWQETLKYCRASGMSEAAAGRITPLRGDVAKPLLGLEPSEYEDLSARLTHIVHAAGVVRLNNDLEKARRDAVLPLTRILELAQRCAAAGQFRKLDYVSTVGVAGRTSGLIAETPQQPQNGYHNTYEAAKAEAEWLALRHSDAGLPVTIHRPSMVVGDSRSGRVSSYQVFYHLADFFVGRRTCGIVPGTGSVKLDIVPSDYVAAAICTAIDDEATVGRILHLCSGPDVAPTIASLTESLSAIYRRHGVKLPPLVRVPLGEYVEQLPALAELVGEQQSRFLGALPSLLAYLETDQTFGNERTRRILTASGVELPTVESYLDRIVTRFLTSRTQPQAPRYTGATEDSTHGTVAKNR